MMKRVFLPVLLASCIASVVIPSIAPSVAQQGGRNSPPLVPLPQTYETAIQRIRVSTVAAGLANPWSLAFLPDGGMLVTERAGRLRIIQNGVLAPQPVSGVPEVRAAGLGGLLDVALHPQFRENRVLYLSYSKSGEGNR